MRNYLFLLAASALLGQCNEAAAQTATSQGQTADQPIFPIIRSSAASVNPPPAKPNGGKGIAVNQAEMYRCCERIMQDVQRVFFLRDHNGRMKMQVKGVYAHGSAIFFLLQLNNRSPLDYEVDSIRFVITDAPGSRHPPGVSKALDPVYVYDTTAMVPGHTRAASIFVLPRFRLPAGRQLLIDVREHHGARHLRIMTTNWTLERARLI
jgi:hypothetical protein